MTFLENKSEYKKSKSDARLLKIHETRGLAFLWYWSSVQFMMGGVDVSGVG